MLVLTVGAVLASGNMAVVAEVVFAEHVLRAGPGGYSLLVATWTAGMVIGTLAGGRQRRDAGRDGRMSRPSGAAADPAAPGAGQLRLAAAVLRRLSCHAGPATGNAALAAVTCQFV